ncbi:MAG TPA: hypothetical protein VHX65_14045 [Pirellulales bacterium]|nr:hypothetical protein [Pirellulales bacterium]
MQTAGNLSDFRWLVSAEAAPWLELAAQEPQPSVAMVSRLRRELSAERAHLVLEQSALRRRGRDKFVAAERMFFTPLGLEQATDEVLAAYKAERFARIARGSSGAVDEPMENGVDDSPSPPAPLPHRGEGRRMVPAPLPHRGEGGRALATPLFADLCCGIGGDLIAIGNCGPTIGVDRDPVAALLAEANLAACGLLIPGHAGGNTGGARGTRESHAGRAVEKCARVQVGDVAVFSVAECNAWHIDPDRRPEGRRTTRAVLHDPPPASIEQLLSMCPNAAVKLAPAAVLPGGWASRAELEWITTRRECRQLVAWFGGLATQLGTRRATVLSAGRQRRTFTGEADLVTGVANRIGRYVFEPDAAILAAGLAGALAREYGLEAVAARGAYLTGEPSGEMLRNSVLRDAALASFEVLDVVPLRVKALRQWLRERGIGRVDVKKRAVDIDPHRLAADLRSECNDHATLLVYSQGEKKLAIIARRLVPADVSGAAE